MGSHAVVIEVDGASARMDRPFAAADVLRMGGILGRGVVIRVDGGRASRFDPSAPITFPITAHPVFRTFRGVAHRLNVDGLRWDWGAPVISVADVRAIGAMPAGLAVEFDGQPGALSPTALIDLTAADPVRLRSRSAPRPTCETPGW